MAGLTSHVEGAWTEVCDRRDRGEGALEQQVGASREKSTLRWDGMGEMLRSAGDGLESRSLPILWLRCAPLECGRSALPVVSGRWILDTCCTVQRALWVRCTGVNQLLAQCQAHHASSSCRVRHGFEDEMGVSRGFSRLLARLPTHCYHSRLWDIRSCYKNEPEQTSLYRVDSP